MKHAISVLLTAIALTVGMSAQQSATNPPNQANLQVSASRYEFSVFTLNPAGAFGATLQTVGTVGPGPQTIYYWIAVNYQVGNAALSGPYVIYTAPSTLNSSHYVQIFAQVPPGTTFDLLKTSTPFQPSGACACAVATGVSAGTSVNDQSNSTSAYTVANFDVNIIKHTMAVEVTGAGDGHVILRKNGVFVCDLDLGCGGGPDTDYYQILQIAGVSKVQRTKLNLIGTGGISISEADNAGADSSDVTINGSGSGGANTISFDQCMPGITANYSNSFWTTQSLTLGGVPTSSWDWGHWEFVCGGVGCPGNGGNTAADLFCTLKWPSNTTAAPPQIIIDLSSADTTAGHTVAFETCDATTTANNPNVGTVACTAGQNYTSTTTAYAVTELTFNVQSTPVVGQYLVAQIHQASSGTNTSNVLMYPPKVKIQ